MRQNQTETMVSKGKHAVYQRKPQNSDVVPMPRHHKEHAPMEAPQENIAPESEPKKKRGKVILGIIGAIVALALIAGAAIAAYMGGLSEALSYKGNADELANALADSEENGSFYVLVIGVDKQEGRSDVMVLTRVDVKNSIITMVSVPRDTPYLLDGSTVKLNEVYADQGEIACIEAVSQLTGVPISHYVKVGFDQLKEVVDNMGGVEVNVPYSFKYYIPGRGSFFMEEGMNFLDGDQALCLARNRKSYDYNGITQDAIRQANIRAIMMALFKQVMSKPVLEIPDQVQAIAEMLETDIPVTDLVMWASELAGNHQITVYSCTGPTEGDLDPETNLWLVDEAPEQWAKIMTEVKAGRDPSKAMERTETADGAVKVGSSDVIEVGAEESPDAIGEDAEE